MLHRCSHSTGAGGGATFSILFPVTGKQPPIDEATDHSTTNYTYPSSSYYSSVDCTLSLGTPSTRQQATHNSSSSSSSTSIQRSSCMPSLCSWDLISQSHKTGGASSSSRAAAASGDPLLLARRCANCDTTSTPLWRNGPRGPKSLCNACGIRYKKEERRAAASSPATAPAAAQRQQRPWSCYPSTTAPASVVEEDDDVEVPSYLSWRLNVVPPQFPVGDRASLFQYQ